MKIKSLYIAAAALVGIAASAEAVVLASWTFEASIPTTAGPLAAEIGTGSATALHSSTSTVYSNPAGNGSVESYSSNFWGIGDYYQFETSSSGVEGITITFDQVGSSTGPRDFKLQYSTDGAAFTDFAGGSYAVLVSTWTTTTPTTINTYTFDLSSITALNNDSSIFFRLTNTSTTSVNGGTVATAGTGRVDNVTVATIPEPASALLGALGFLAILRRRR